MDFVGRCHACPTKSPLERIDNSGPPLGFPFNAAAEPSAAIAPLKPQLRQLCTSNDDILGWVIGMDDDEHRWLHLYPSGVQQGPSIGRPVAVDSPLAFRQYVRCPEREVS
jgi:hypothetical protein